MRDGPIHRELLLPPPVEKNPATVPIVWPPGGRFWLEIQREAAGRIRYSVGAPSTTELDTLAALLENGRSRLSVGPKVRCPTLRRGLRGTFARAVPRQRNHHFPLGIRPDTDPAGFLLRTFGSPALQDHEVVLQLVARRVRMWESNFFSAGYAVHAHERDRIERAAMDARHSEAAYQFELRAQINGPRPADTLTALTVWLGQWTTGGGAPWRAWEVIRPKKERAFYGAFVTHNLLKFASRKSRRDISGTELAHLLTIPWAARHPECSYAGAPTGRSPPELLLRTAGTPADRPRAPTPPLNDRLVVGFSGIHPVTLPAKWNHLALLGRTQSGKSTSALNLALRILLKVPNSSVVVIEPTGTLVEGIVSCLPLAIARDSIEIDPARATYDQNGSAMVGVPLSLLQPPEDGAAAGADPGRWAESQAGNLLVAIRNAWGEESIGGRAELVLRALVQGLALTPNSNLVDAYHILSSKPALQRFVQTAPEGPLRDFLERHLPRLGYDFTMSSLDKVGKIATNSLLRIALCQRASPVSFDRLLNHRLLLLNLSKSALGADGANFLGAIYLTQLWAAIQRSGRPDHPVYLVLDEVHNYAVPTLADMLSEGAKFGLHVVAATQYLHRVPPRVRAALLGNVDAWLLFSMGVEDMDDAWKIVNGAGHGWVPQDLVDGLPPHEVALAVSGSLVKLRTLPPPSWASTGVDRQEVVTQSSRRYAQLEDSEASPWLVGLEDVERLLAAIGERPRTRAELHADGVMAPPQLEAILTRSTSAGDIEGAGPGATLRLTDRGSAHLRALQPRKNEGEAHIDTLTDFAMFLRSRGIALAIPDQVAGVLTPDGQFRWGGATYNVEVESSTVATAVGQVIRNVQKALAAGHRVLVVLPHRDRLPRALALLATAFPRLLLWTDGVGVVWREGSASFSPHRMPGTTVWPFLVAGSLPTSSATLRSSQTAVVEIADTDPLMGALRAAIHGLVASGERQATSQELLAALPERQRMNRTDEQVGIALSALGVTHRRIRSGDARVRVYDLLSLDDSEGVTPGRPSDGPGVWTDAGNPSDVVHPGPPRRSTDSPMENEPDGPADPAGPAD